MEIRISYIIAQIQANFKVNLCILLGGLIFCEIDGRVDVEVMGEVHEIHAGNLLLDGIRAIILQVDVDRVGERLFLFVGKEADDGSFRMPKLAFRDNPVPVKGLEDGADRKGSEVPRRTVPGPSFS